ncbi:hypothetical protein BBH99_15555 [Chryseobacterium contaminans]|uniref:Uncharacterized protein n=1 Tax=Chryseobacterium contaminans TaxID=1423959 RepID=A0A1M6XT86_9FLAO|nr:hypothetical protein [Chryseobacterium contaminans]OCA80428.1 hypothetical protein BBH99_15555 [Chryseobacterium contaminans]SHL09025.1 hypothetical protein SAMN05444407_102205 [Chryseobacterium contaminans]
MNFKNIKYFFLAFLITGFIFTKSILPVSYQVRTIIGFILLIVYFFGAYILIYRPIVSDNKLKKHLFLRLGVLILLLLIALISLWQFKDQNIGMGAGYILYFVMMVLGYATLLYAIIESLLLYSKKKYEQTTINLALVLAIYCFVMFSGLFGF